MVARATDEEHRTATALHHQVAEDHVGNGVVGYASLFSATWWAWARPPSWSWSRPSWPCPSGQSGPPHHLGRWHSALVPAAAVLVLASTFTAEPVLLTGLLVVAMIAASVVVLERPGTA